MGTSFEILRAENAIKGIVKKLNLNLTGLNVLTEAGSNHFIYTPLIAYFGGASKIFIWIKDTSYGLASDIKQQFDSILEVLNIDSEKFEFALNCRPESHIAQADLVTNLGFVRPLDEQFLRNLKTGAVISYMCEAWEIRQGDVDISFCKQQNIPIAGVWENHPDLLIFKGCGMLSVKICLEAGFEVYQNRILILSSDKFGEAAFDAFFAAGATIVELVKPEKIHTIDCSHFDFLFVADYSFPHELIGKENENKFINLNKTAVIHLCGRVDFNWVNSQGIYCYPNQEGYHARMTRTLAHLGVKPIVDLHAAGMKVGEYLYKNEHSELVQLI